jgi:ribosome recycling factor
MNEPVHIRVIVREVMAHFEQKRKTQKQVKEDQQSEAKAKINKTVSALDCDYYN